MSQADTKTPPATSRFQKIISPIVFLLLALSAMGGFLRLFAPKPVELNAEQVEDQKFAQLTSEPVARNQLQIVALGSRFCGQPGHAAAASLVRSAYQAAGLQMLELSTEAVVPQTLERRVCDSRDQLLSNVAIYPFFPNGLQPMNTPATGISGELVLASDDLLAHRVRADDAVVLIDSAHPPEGAGLNWARYAAAGFKALIVSNHQGLAAIDWGDTVKSDGGLVGTLPVNFVRVAATPEIFQYVGQHILLHVKTRYAQVEAPTLVGILHGGQPASTPHEAVVITANYDAPSVLPDLAPGVLSAVPLATQLALLEQLAADPARLRRDVIFVATGAQTAANIGTTDLLAAIGPAVKPEATMLRLQRDLAANQSALHQIAAIRPVIDSPALFSSATHVNASLLALAAGDELFFEQQFQQVTGTISADFDEQQLQARLDFLRTGADAPRGPAFTRYMAAKQKAETWAGFASLPPQRLLSEQQPDLVQAEFASKLRQRFDELQHFHEQQRLYSQQAIDIYQRFRAYSRLILLEPNCLPAPGGSQEKSETVAAFMGQNVEDEAYVQYPQFQRLLQGASQISGASCEPLAARRQSDLIATDIPDLFTSAECWNRLSFPALSVVDTDRPESYARRGDPVAQPFMSDLSSCRLSLRTIGELAWTLASGGGSFQPPLEVQLKTFTGQVLASGGGEGNFTGRPLSGAIWYPRAPDPSVTPCLLFPHRGFLTIPMRLSDPYGRYCLADYAGIIYILDYSAEAAGYDSTGTLCYVQDQGIAGQTVCRSKDLNLYSATGENINVPVFRASPLCILDLTNPQTLAPYTDIDLLLREGLTPVQAFNHWQFDGGITMFAEPDAATYIALKSPMSDASANAASDATQQTSAFLLGLELPGAEADPKVDISGPGYLVADTPLLKDVPRAAATAMLSVNGKRLDMLNRLGMGDDLMREFHAKALTSVQQAQVPGTSQLDREQLYRQAVTYLTLNHPEIRRVAWEAVVSILWYLALLVPFSFFFEKLAFGSPDVRKQLLVQTATLLSVFVLLKLLHPAFELVRSSLMILLGFVVLLISAGITILFAGKFAENLEALSSRRGKVSAAKVSSFGVVGTALLLGLNNMARRRVRTGLTCGTLVLITFALICLTSTTSELRDQQLALGKAAYQGLLVKHASFAKLDDSELFALRTRYGRRFAVTPRYAFTGVFQIENSLLANPSVEITYNAPGTPARVTDASGVLILDPRDPVQNGIVLKTTSGWIPKPSADGIPFVLLSESMAEHLGLPPQEVDAQHPIARLDGADCRVWGIFDSESLDRWRDLDGYSLLPFDAEAVTHHRMQGSDLLADDAGPRIPAQRVVLAGAGRLGLPPHATQRLVSAAVDFDALSYHDASDLVQGYLEQTNAPAVYGLDGVAYRGLRSRASSTSGLLELLVPLLVAGMTVLNTMRGSVYERRDEIFVYNAVGIAPRYIFFMFMAEAAVYGVVGCVLGFLLSQGIGRALTALDWTGGMNMSYTSLNTVIASVTVMIAVFVSTLFPALSAMRIAAPAEDASWKLPVDQEDALAFPLPFTFDSRDRMAVLMFFQRILLDHGEGGAAAFTAAPPKVEIVEMGGDLLPQVGTTLWLQPFDLGVSQSLTISLPADAETGEYAAHVNLVRHTGSREAWRRLNGPFVASLRRHFLHWRAVDAEGRAELFVAAKELLLGPDADAAVLNASAQEAVG